MFHMDTYRTKVIFVVNTLPPALKLTK